MTLRLLALLFSAVLLAQSEQPQPAAMQLLVVREKVNQIVRLSDYRKFNAESKLVAVQE